MSTGLERLDRIRQGKVVSAEPWTCPPFHPRYAGEVLAFDQSLSSTGWALLRPIKPYLIAAGTIVTDPDMGHEGNLKRGVEVYDAFSPILERVPRALVVHETPPVGGQMSRPESSLLAAMALRIAASGSGHPVHMVGAQRAKRRMTGKPNATKPEVERALKLFWPHLPIVRPWNGHIRDAIVLGIVAYEEYAASE